jgi:diguanylate cyclase (GGDEF)-like protein
MDPYSFNNRSSKQDVMLIHRSRMMTPLGIFSILVMTSIIPDCFFLKPASYYLTGIAVGIMLRLLAAILNRKGYTEYACQLSIFSIMAACAIPLLFSPHAPVFPALPVYCFLCIAISQSGYLIHKKAPFGVAMISVGFMWTHILRNTLYSSAIIPIAFIHQFIFVGILFTQIFFLFAILSWVNAAQTEIAIVGADRKEEIEQLYAELQGSHHDLELEHQKVQDQSRLVSDLNEKLFAIQSELERSNQRLETLNTQLEEQATTDSMTGLANRRMFHDALHSRISQAIRHHQPLTLLMLDVDFFKSYNDAYGHQAGDVVLQKVAELLNAATRAGDVCARYGGEEFAIILSYTEPPTALVVAERIRQSIENFGFPNRSITISIGLACLHSNITGSESFIAEADAALYMAKEQGRNRVVVATIPENAIMPPTSNTLYPADLMPAKKEAYGFSRQKYAAPMHRQSFDPFGGIEGLLQEPSGPILSTLLSALDLRCAETLNHSLRVARYCMRLTTSLVGMSQRHDENYSKLPHIAPSDWRDIALGALLHDIGKIRMPEYILRKPDHLSDEEIAIMQRHTIIGAELISEFPLLIPALPTVLHHHERWDGSGYPDGLAENAIPLAARIFAVCDTFDALTTARSYRQSLGYPQAKEVLIANSGTQFDPLIVKAFTQIDADEWRSLAFDSIITEDYPLAA